MLIFCLSESVSLCNRCPKGITIRLLQEEHADPIDSKWPFAYPGSLDTTKQYIRYGPCIGAFDDDDRLVAWICLLVNLNF